MNEILLNIKIGDSQDFNIDEDLNYDSFLSTKSRLKRQGKGEWQSKLHGRTVTIKRTA